MFNLAKKEKEEAKIQKKRNMKQLASVLDSMTIVDHTTTWYQVQEMLLNNQNFVNDPKLLGLTCFNLLINKYRIWNIE